MRIVAGVGIVAAIACVLLVIYTLFPALAVWAVAQQRAFQNELALAVHAIRAGDALAWFALLAAAGGYGFVHAVGPGHGKYLIAGVGLGQQVSSRKLLAIAFASSMAQSLWAIVLVYGGLSVLAVSAQHLTQLAETYLAAASYLAIAAIGLVLMWRGVVILLRERRTAKAHQHHSHDEHCGCGSRHGPSAEEVAGLKSVRETVALILSIAIRPCTGAVFLLVIAWQLDIPWAGAAAVIVMGLGTASLTSLVAVSSVGARGLARISVDRMGMATLVMPVLQILSGVAILMFGAMLFEVMIR